MIQIQNLSFTWPTGSEPVFNHLNLTLDTSWKLGLTGRNGRGKTTLLKLLENETSPNPDPNLEHSGSIQADCIFSLFPFHIENPQWSALSNFYAVFPDLEIWKLEKEVRLLGMDPDLLDQPFETLSGGEQTRLMLACLFSMDTHFLLIDEPTNHLDLQGRKAVAKYLSKKSGFILVSHDQAFMDQAIDHVLALESSGPKITQGTLSQYLENKNRLLHDQMILNSQLKKEIKGLEASARQASQWSSKAEKAIYHNGPVDRGFLSHKAAKMNQRSKNLARQKENAIEQKSSLLQDLEETEKLKLPILPFEGSVLIQASHFQAGYESGPVFSPVSFALHPKERLAITGSNGCGKSTLLHAIQNIDLISDGILTIDPRVKISFLSQKFEWEDLSLEEVCEKQECDQSLVKAILRKLGFEREQFLLNLKDYSMGMQKKLMIAIALSRPANLFIFDEPLNYLDLEARKQLEQVILDNEPTLLFVEHDELFLRTVSTNQLEIKSL